MPESFIYSPSLCTWLTFELHVWLLELVALSALLAKEGTWNTARADFAWQQLEANPTKASFNFKCIKRPKSTTTQWEPNPTSAIKPTLNASNSWRKPYKLTTQPFKLITNPYKLTQCVAPLRQIVLTSFPVLQDLGRCRWGPGPHICGKSGTLMVNSPVEQMR